MESSKLCNLSDHLLKTKGEEVCGVYLAYRPLAWFPPGLTLPPLDPCPLPLTLTAAPLFHFPPNNSVTNWACQKTIYHCPTSHPPLPSAPSSSLFLFVSLSPSVPVTGHSLFFLFVFFPILMVSCFSLHGHFIFLPLLFFPHITSSPLSPLLLHCILLSMSPFLFLCSCFLTLSTNLFCSVIFSVCSVSLSALQVHYGIDSYSL